MDPAILAHDIDAIKTPKVRSAYGQMVDFDVDAKVGYDVELRAVDENQVVKTCIERSNDAYQTWPNSADSV